MQKNNILYLLRHQTLTDFEVPILVRKGFGVLIVKTPTRGGHHSEHKNAQMYDNFVNLSVEDIRHLNSIDWFGNQRVGNDTMLLLNRSFKYIFVTLLTTDPLITQLASEFKGMICYRFFGRESTHRYFNIVPAAPNIRYIFSYPEIYNFEVLHSQFFNSANSYVVPLGLSNYHILSYRSTYKAKSNIICFVCSKIGKCPYYTDIYNRFVREFGKYEHVILGRNNLGKDPHFCNDLEDAEYYKRMSECKVMYYHGTEPRHLHYHPLEAMVIGLPIVFYKCSLLSSFLPNSPGQCTDLNEAKKKLDRILFDNDKCFIDEIIARQNESIAKLTVNHNKDIFDRVLGSI